MNQTQKGKNFEKVASTRVESAIQKIHSVGNLSREQLFDYTDEQAEMLCAALEEEVARTRKRFQNRGKFFTLGAEQPKEKYVVCIKSDYLRGIHFYEEATDPKGSGKCWKPVLEAEVFMGIYLAQSENEALEKAAEKHNLKVECLKATRV